MAVAALWISATTSEERPIRVIRRAPDRITEFGAGRFVSDTTMVDVRVSDLPDPRAGDLIVIGADSFTIQGEPRARPRTPDLVAGPAPIMKLTPDIDPDLVAVMAAESASVISYLNRFIALWNNSERLSQACFKAFAHIIPGGVRRLLRLFHLRLGLVALLSHFRKLLLVFDLRIGLRFLGVCLHLVDLCVPLVDIRLCLFHICVTINHRLPPRF